MTKGAHATKGTRETNGVNVTNGTNATKVFEMNVIRESCPSEERSFLEEVALSKCLTFHLGAIGYKYSH